MTKARDIASAAPAPSTVSATELGYLDGVTSAIQTQVDGKVAASIIAAKGDLIVGTANDTPGILTVASTAGYTLVADSAEATGLKWAAPGGGGSLTLITPTSTANSSGSVSTSGGEVTFTSVASVSLNGVFTSTYTNYLITTDSIIGNGNLDMSMRLRASGSDTTSNYKIMLWDKPFASGVEAPVSLGTNTLGTTNWYMSDTNGSEQCMHSIYISSPQKSIDTNFTASAIGRVAYQTIGGTQTDSTSFDGFTLTASTGTVSGVVRVYGYSKS